MPLLAKLLVWLLGNVYALVLAAFGAKWAVRVTALAALASLYTLCAVTFSVMIIPWFAALISTTYGYLLGLLFPAAAGTVVASLGVFWSCILAKRYSAKLIKMAVT